MPHIETHAPGSFCWFELATSDQEAAKRFYGSLFGWSAADSPIGADESYTIFSLEGRDTGACYTLRPDMRAQGIPPHWMLYVRVENTDQTTAKVEPAGGKLAAGPFDVMEHGRMAVVQDPAGASFCIWQPKAHPGTRIEEVPGTVCWADLMTPDQAGAVKFYQAVFGWQGDPGKDASGYMHIKSGEKFIGGIPPAAHLPPGAPPHWMLYFQVEDCDAATAKATESGAKVYMPPMTMEGVGRFAVIADPQDAVLALFQPGR